jgi:DNA-binding XRE family transcriptional regulator
MDGGGHDRASALARHYRRAAGLTQRQLAGAAGLSIGVVRDLEQGRTSRLQARSADALARALSLGGRPAGEFVRAVRGGADAAPCAARRPACGLACSGRLPCTMTTARRNSGRRPGVPSSRSLPSRQAS